MRMVHYLQCVIKIQDSLYYAYTRAKYVPLARNDFKTELYYASQMIFYYAYGTLFTMCNTDYSVK
jgi:hypothetical protein